MRIIIFFALIAIVTPSLQAQGRIKAYHARIELKGGSTVKGFILNLNDSSIQLYRGKGPNNDTTLNVSQIKILSLRIKNAPGRRFLAGFALGAVLGAGIGYATYSTPECNGGFCIDFGPSYSALGGAFLGSIGGGLIGLLTGLNYNHFGINGDVTKYQELRTKMLMGHKLK